MKSLIKRILDYANNHKNEVSVLVYGECLASDTQENENFLRANGMVWHRISIDERVAKFNRISFESYVASQVGGIQW